MRKRTLVCSAAFLLLIPAAVSAADAVPGRWERVEALIPGTEVLVDIRGGERLEGDFAQLGPDEITFTDGTGMKRILPREAILKIQTAVPVRDRLCNGSLIGSLAGAAAGLAVMVGYASAVTNGPVYWDEDGAGYLVAAALAGGGIGAAAGALIDSSIEKNEVLYQAR